MVAGDVLVVGSGASGVHLAQTLLERGHGVTMLDVGHQGPRPVLPDADFVQLKNLLEDPVEYFLGTNWQGAVLPGENARYYTMPPSRDHVFRHPRPFQVSPTNFEPVMSFASGGLAEALTGGCYPFNDAELENFPFDYSEIERHYATVIRRIGVTAARDDLAQFSGWFDEYSEPLATDAHSTHLLRAYGKRRKRLNADLKFHLGRSRVAVLTKDRGERRACDNLGRCLWGCPRESVYAPSSTLRELKRHPRFQYIGDTFVSHFSYRDNTVVGITATAPDGSERVYTADHYALAAGALCSSKILLDSIYRGTGELHQLDGLMDNPQLLVPFMSPRLLGEPAQTRSYQLHHLALGIEAERVEDYVHGQITTLKSVAVHPIAQSLPLDLRSALNVFRNTHVALGAANVWLCDRPDRSNVLTIRPTTGASGGATELVVKRQGEPDAAQVLRATETVQSALRQLGCVVPAGKSQLLRSGASIHYAGTMPMMRSRRHLACDPDCRSQDFRNLFFADGASFPFLPAKNLTFTLMANAIRVGESMSRNFNA